ncbi:MAG: hypothetical protein WCG04_02095 [Alphaproteobacteria bacterium]
MLRIYRLSLVILVGAFFCAVPLHAMDYGDPLQPHMSPPKRTALQMLKEMGNGLNDVITKYESALAINFAYARTPEETLLLQTEKLLKISNTEKYLRSFANLLSTGKYNDPKTNDGLLFFGSINQNPSTKIYGIRKKPATKHEKTLILGYVASLATAANVVPEFDSVIRNELKKQADQYGRDLGQEHNYKIKHSYLVLMAYDFMKRSLELASFPQAARITDAKLKQAGIAAIPADLIGQYVNRLSLESHVGDFTREDYIADMEAGGYHQLRRRLGNYFSTFDEDTRSLKKFLDDYVKYVTEAREAIAKAQLGQQRVGVGERLKAEYGEEEPEPYGAS